MSPELPLHLPTVSLLISNLHCPSCVETITSLLAPLSAIRNLSISFLLHTITFSVDTSRARSSSKVTKSVDVVVDDVKAVLAQEGGFLIADKEGEKENGERSNEREQGGEKRGDSWLARFWRGRRQSKEERRAAERRRRHFEHCGACQKEEEARKAGIVPSSTTSLGHATSPTPSSPGEVTTIVSIEGMTCASCTTSISESLLSHSSVLSVNIILLSSSGTIRHRSSLPPSEVIELIEDSGFEAKVVSSRPDASALPATTQQMWKSTFMITGMTCASCSTAIDTALRGHGGVEAASIDVLGNKGVIVHSFAVTTDQLKDIIEEQGYGAEPTSREEIPDPSTKKPKTEDEGEKSRIVTIRIQGVFCNNCITQLHSHLAELPFLSYTPMSLSSPVTTIAYVPQNPLNIRSILQGLSDVAPELEAEVVKSQSLSQRGQEIQKREAKLLAIHLAVAVLFAIPTFIM